jgi:hypothetical protein
MRQILMNNPILKLVATVLLFGLVGPLLGCLLILPILIPIASPSSLPEAPQFVGVVFKAGGVPALVAGLIFGIVKSTFRLRTIFAPRWKSAVLGGMSGLIAVLITYPPRARWNTFAVGGTDIMSGLGVLSGVILSVCVDRLLFKGENVGA